MQYMLLIYDDKANGPVPGTPEWDALLVDYGKFGETVTAAGAMVSGNALQPVSTATTVRVRNEEPTTFDGPFAETKETLGGYYLLDCKDLDEAMRYAAMIPSARFGSIEIRPVMTFD